VARAPVVQVRGAKELRATMKRAGMDLADLKATHDAIARLVASTGQGRAPVRTGRLAGSVRGSGAATVATVRAGGASVPYANAIHWGWKAHHISPNPFLAQTAADTEPVWTRYYLIAVENILDKVKGI
jgi:hypothetical protein